MTRIAKQRLGGTWESVSARAAGATPRMTRIAKQRLGGTWEGVSARAAGADLSDLTDLSDPNHGAHRHLAAHSRWESLFA